MQFSASAPSAIARNGRLQFTAGGTAAIIQIDSVANQITLDYQVAGYCGTDVYIRLYLGNALVDEQNIGHCGLDGVYSGALQFDRIVLDTPNAVPSGNTIWFDNLVINLMPVVTNTPSSTPSASPTDTPEVPTATSTSTDTDEPLPPTLTAMPTFTDTPPTDEPSSTP